MDPTNQNIPPIGTLWGDLTDEQRDCIPDGTVLGPPSWRPEWGDLTLHARGWRDRHGDWYPADSLHSARPILSYPPSPEADPRPSTVTIRLTPALYARALKAKMPEGERDLGEWLVSRAEVAATARADALEEAAQTCEGLGRDFAEAFPETDRRIIRLVRAACVNAAHNIRNLTAKKEAP